MEKNFKLFGTDKTVENTMVVRRTLEEEESIFCSIFGYFPKFRCMFRIHTDSYSERLKKMEELYKEFLDTGFETFSVTYSNNNKDDDDDVDSGNCTVSKEIAMNSFVVFNDDVLVSFGCGFGDIIIMVKDSQEKLNYIIDKYLSRFVFLDDKVRCNIIAHHDIFYMEEFEIKVKGDLDFDLYNDGFEEIHNEIIRSIKEDENGLYILHGEAGTGKTTYIRHLIKELKRNKKFVYVPSSLVDDITSPTFISFILENKNCVFIIEDCENLVVTKNNTRSSAVADMLNITDGILADALKIKFICTFNINEKNIDEALLRPGRCRMRYDFGKLKKEKAIKAADKLGLKVPNKDISLAELFAGENKFVEEKRKIGF